MDKGTWHGGWTQRIKNAKRRGARSPSPCRGGIRRSSHPACTRARRWGNPSTGTNRPPSVSVPLVRTDEPPPDTRRRAEPKPQESRRTRFALSYRRHLFPVCCTPRMAYSCCAQVQGHCRWREACNQGRFVRSSSDPFVRSGGQHWIDTEHLVDTEQIERRAWWALPTRGGEMRRSPVQVAHPHRRCSAFKELIAHGHASNPAGLDPNEQVLPVAMTGWKSPQVS